MISILDICRHHSGHYFYLFFCIYVFLCFFPVLNVYFQRSACASASVFLQVHYNFKSFSGKILFLEVWLKPEHLLPVFVGKRENRQFILTGSCYTLCFLGLMSEHEMRPHFHSVLRESHKSRNPAALAGRELKWQRPKRAGKNEGNLWNELSAG